MGSQLFDYSYAHNFDYKIEMLSYLAAKENWQYRHTESNDSHPILRNYINHTFSRIFQEEKIYESNDKEKSCLNTGLVTENQEEIFMIFSKNKNKDKQPWFLDGFFKESDRELIVFSELPPLANYFSETSSLLYDTRVHIRKNLDHIIDENKQRFPEPFALMKENHQLNIALNGAIDHALRRVQRNYRTAVPQFYQGGIQLLLPLCMTNKKTADLALVIYKQNDVYLASTCLTLDMAYNNARLLAKPDSDWLEP